MESGVWGQPWGSHPSGYVGPGGHDRSAGWFSPELYCCCTNSWPNSTSSESLAGGKSSKASFLSWKSDAAAEQCALGKQNWWVRRCHFHAVTFLPEQPIHAMGLVLEKNPYWGQHNLLIIEVSGKFCLSEDWQIKPIRQFLKKKKISLYYAFILNIRIQQISWEQPLCKTLIFWEWIGTVIAKPNILLL